MEKNISKSFISNFELRLILLIIVAIDIVMTTVAIFMYPPLLTMPDSYSYIAEMGIILTIYIFIVILVTKFSTDRYILGVSTLFGVMAAILEIVHISIENFGHLNGHAEAVSTGIFMITLFLIFGVSGFYIAIRTKKISSGVWGGSWSAVVCMLLVMTYGLSQLFWSFAAIEKHNIGNPDFIRTGWTDMHAFVIADIFEACFKVLFLGPIIGIIFGLFGAAIAQFFVRKNLNR